MMVCPVYMLGQSQVSLVGYGPDDVCSQRGQGIFIFTSVRCLSSDPHSLLFKVCPRAVYRGVKRPGRSADHTSDPVKG